MNHNVYKAGIPVVLVLLLAILVSLPAHGQQSPQPSGTVTINEYELAYIFNGQMGGGKLNFHNKVYDFKLGGLGIGGIGASHINASGEVYHLDNISQFQGTYVQASVGYSATDQGKGHVWLQNQNGVVLHLKTSQQGLGLTAGADGIVVKMD